MSLKKSLTLLNKIVEADGSPKGKKEIFSSYETYDFYGAWGFSLSSFYWGSK